MSDYENTSAQSGSVVHTASSAPVGSGQGNGSAMVRATTQAIAPNSYETGGALNSPARWEFTNRRAKAYASATMPPPTYRLQNLNKKLDQWEDNPSAIPNCIIAISIADRMNADPLMVMQNLHIIEGRPSWSSPYIISSINTCGKFSPLRYAITKLGKKDVEYTALAWKENANGRRFPEEVKKTATIDDMSCIAWAIEKATGERLESPEVSMTMAVVEGWYGKNGSKWQTMPGLMIRYRAAAFFGRLYAPELLMGLPTQDEAADITVDARPGEWENVKERGAKTVGKPISRLDALENTIFDAETGEILIVPAATANAPMQVKAAGKSRQAEQEPEQEPSAAIAEANKPNPAASPPTASSATPYQTYRPEDRDDNHGYDAYDGNATQTDDSGALQPTPTQDKPAVPTAEAVDHATVWVEDLIAKDFSQAQTQIELDAITGSAAVSGRFTRYLTERPELYEMMRQGYSVRQKQIKSTTERAKKGMA